MVVVGLSALLTTLLLVFLLPRGGVQAQSQGGSNGGSDDPSAGSKFTSPPFFPARTILLHMIVVDCSDWQWIGAMG